MANPEVPSCWAYFRVAGDPTVIRMDAPCGLLIYSLYLIK